MLRMVAQPPGKDGHGREAAEDEREEMMRRIPTGRVSAAAIAAGALLLGPTLAACSGGDGGEGATDAEGRPVVNVLVVQNTNQVSMTEMGWTEDLEEACGC